MKVGQISDYLAKNNKLKEKGQEENIFYVGQ